MTRYTKHTGEWGSFVDIKVNGPAILERQLSSTRKSYCGSILIGSVTDAYQPCELKYKMTRHLLEILRDHQMEISILTKSHNILRDLDILMQFQTCSIGVSINSIDDRFRKVFEPNASSVAR